MTPSATVQDAIDRLAAAVSEQGREVGKEGKGGPGAIEYLAESVRDGCHQIATSIDGLAEAVTNVASRIDG